MLVLVVDGEKKIKLWIIIMTSYKLRMIQSLESWQLNSCRVTALDGLHMYCKCDNCAFYMYIS